MDFTNLIVGLVLIGLGFLGKAFPLLIAGYNTLPEEKKKNINEKRFLVAFRNGFILMGLAVILGYYFFMWIDLPSIATIIAPVVIVIGVVLLNLFALTFQRKVGHKKKRNNTKVIYIILAVSLTFVAGSTLIGLYPSKLAITEDSIKFWGMYGMELKSNQIEEVEVIQQIPKILKRTNGFSFLMTKKGSFALKNMGQCHLLLHSDNSPYLLISMRNGERIIYNNKDSTKTFKIFEEIKSVIQ